MIGSLSILAVVVVAQEQISTDLDGECVILHLRSGEYFGLDEIGSHIWSLVQEPRSVQDLRDSILATYEVDDLRRCERDLLDFLAELVSEGLVRVVN